jgi:hypothetical protein
MSLLTTASSKLSDQTRPGQPGESQRKITDLLRVVTERPTLPLIKEETSFQNTQMSLKEQKYSHGSS